MGERAFAVRWETRNRLGVCLPGFHLSARTQSKVLAQVDFRRRMGHFSGFFVVRSLR